MYSKSRVGNIINGYLVPIIKGQAEKMYMVQELTVKSITRPNEPKYEKLRN